MKKTYTKIMDKLASIKSDKLLHFIAGSYIGQAVTLIAAPHCYDPFLAPALGIAAGFVAGNLKEVFDKVVMKENGEYKDMIATFLGSIIGTLLISLL